MCLRKIAEKQLKKGEVKKKFAPLAEILMNKKYFERLLKVSVFKGKSILEDGVEEAKEKK